MVKIRQRARRSLQHWDGSSVTIRAGAGELALRTGAAGKRDGLLSQRCYADSLLFEDVQQHSYRVKRSERRYIVLGSAPSDSGPVYEMHSGQDCPGTDNIAYMPLSYRVKYLIDSFFK